MTLICPKYTATEEMKTSRYKDMLCTKIREFLTATKHRTLDDMIASARRRKIKLESHNRKRKAVQAVTQESSLPKKSRVSDS